MKRVLVVDDSPFVRDAVRVCLEAGGFEVVDATDGISGLQALQADGENISLCIIDIHMPEKDGLTMIQEARLGGHQMPMLVLSTETSLAMREKIRKAGADGRITKPVDGEVLIAAVKHLLEPNV